MQFIGFYHNVEETFVALLFTGTKITFAYILAFKMALIKLVGKVSAVCSESVKTAKCFSYIAFTIYSINLLVFTVKLATYEHSHYQ